jgi:hypothetical protein
MTFMQAQAVQMTAHIVETTNGSEIVPVDLVGLTPSPDDLRDFIEGAPNGDDIETVTGWFSRFSAPGYLDRTDWSGPFETREQALNELAVLHDACPHCFEQCWENEEGECAESGAY